MTHQLLAVLFCMLFAAAAAAHGPSSPCAPAAQSIPARSAQAHGASEFVAAIVGLGDHERDAAIRDQLLAGNLPGFLRQAVPATVQSHLADGRSVRLTLCVLSDYLALGSDDDFLLVPLALDSAIAVASQFGFMLPTRRIVDLIYRAAAVRLMPRPLPANERMRSTAYLREHDALVAQQRSAIGAQPGTLIAGHKKDLVLSARLSQQPGRVAIYGWHRGEGAPIQTLSTVHGARYADYSHGVRLVGQTVYVDGRPTSIFELLADPKLAPLLSDEGPLPHAAARLGARVGDTTLD